LASTIGAASALAILPAVVAISALLAATRLPGAAPAPDG